MTINYTTEPLKPQRTYPWVGKCSNSEGHSTVLFIAPEHGFCLDSSDQTDLDDRESDAWRESEFVPCSITLSSL